MDGINEFLGVATEEKTFSQEVIQNGGIETPTKKGGADDFATLFKQADLTKVSATEDFVALEDGEYLSTVNKISIKLTNTGKPLATVEYVVVDGEKAKRKAWENIWLTNKDNEISLGKLVQRFMTIFKSTEEQAAQAAIKVVGDFTADTNKPLIMDKENGIAKDNVGKLKISSYEFTPKSGKNEGIKQTGQNYSFSA